MFAKDTPHIHFTKIVTPNAPVQRGRERPHGEPHELRFAASAATGCSAANGIIVMPESEVQLKPDETVSSERDVRKL